MIRLTEKQAEAKLKKYNKQILTRIGHKNATTNHELNIQGRALFKSKWLGVFMQDSKIPKSPKSAYFIINVDRKHQAGSHWIGIHRTIHDTYYIFDSFGRRSNKLIPLFVRGKIHIDSDNDQNQHIDSKICGSLSLAWLKVIKEHGIRNALLI